MESGSANKISKTSISLHLNDPSNSRRRTQPKMFITLIIFFIVIIAAILSVLTMIKQDYDSELPANNPEKAIKSICRPTPYYDTCFRYMSNSLYKNNKLLSSKITSSQIFSISLRNVIDKLHKITYLLRSYDSLGDAQSTPSPCDSQYFHSSLSPVKTYLAIDEVENITAATMTMRSEMLDWLHTERPKISRCLYSLEYDKGLETGNVNHCLVILANTNIISDMLDSSSVFSFDSFRSSGKKMVDLLFQDQKFVDVLCTFGVQYSFLLLLFCMLVRVW